MRGLVLTGFKKRKSTLLTGLLFLVWMSVGCHPKSCLLEPDICLALPPGYIQSLPSPFPPLAPHEKAEDWGRELFIGRAFAKETDLYRALTCFKRALFLIPRTHGRRFEIEYEIFFAYYTAGKYEDAVEAFESSRLFEVPDSFPALQDLLIALYDAYIKTDRPERACRILSLIDIRTPMAAADLRLESAIMDADIPGIVDAANCSRSTEAVNAFLYQYQNGSKSVAKAQWFNAILPGAGYLYVGQKQSAMTSFLINALFIAAAYQLFDHGYIPAGILVTSLETGWYFGGINGAGLEAKQYNQILYERLGRETLSNERLFPILMIEHGF